MSLGLKELHSAEAELVEALPALTSGVKDATLTGLLLKAAARCSDRVTGLRGMVGAAVDDEESTDCKPLQEMICECKAHSENAETEPELRDAAVLASIQAIVHWRIAKYGTMKAYAEDLGKHKQADTLGNWAEEEGTFDRELTRIAERSINFKAADV